MVIERENTERSPKNWLEKIGKRNLIIMAAVLVIGAAVWVNWMLLAPADGYDGYGQNSDMTDVAGDNAAENEGDNTSLTDRARSVTDKHIKYARKSVGASALDYSKGSRA